MLKYKNFFPFFWSGTVNFFELVFVFGKNAVFFEFAVADKKNFRFLGFGLRGAAEGNVKFCGFLSHVNLTF